VTPYGVALALAFAAGIGVARRRAPRAGLRSEAVLDASFVILACALVGARALWVATHMEEVAGPDGSWFALLLPMSGLSMLGGVGLGALAALAYLRLRGLPVLRYADVLAPSAALGEAIARIGCLLQGCCPGLPTSLPWGRSALGGTEAAIRFGDAPLHPAPAYAALAALAVFVTLGRIGPHAPAGSVLFAFLVLAGAARLALDPLRAYEGPAIASANHALAASLLAAGIVGFACLRGRRSRVPGAPPR
jgi:phosphatidylglycerol:prolipoprotein diacylglycerol transferase